MQKKKGFSLVEVLVVIAIIGVIATIILVALGGATKKARDTKRKATVSQIARLFSLSCYMPQGGPGEYDIADLAGEITTKYPQAANIIKSIKDPKTGTDAQYNYKYIVSDDGKKCVLYANLENEDEPITLKDISTATPRGGTGVFEAADNGWNGTKKYFQVSN